MLGPVRLEPGQASTLWRGGFLWEGRGQPVGLCPLLRSDGGKSAPRQRRRPSVRLLCGPRPVRGRIAPPFTFARLAARPVSFSGILRPVTGDRCCGRLQKEALWRSAHRRGEERQVVDAQDLVVGFRLEIAIGLERIGEVDQGRGERDEAGKVGELVGELANCPERAFDAPPEVDRRLDEDAGASAAGSSTRVMAGAPDRLRRGPIDRRNLSGIASRRRRRRSRRG